MHDLSSCLLCAVFHCTYRNTVHIDDLSRNFALNPKNGIKCSAYRRESATAATDNELQLLAFYLVHIATKPAAATATGGGGGGSSEGGQNINLIAWDHGKWRETAMALSLGSSLSRN